MNGRKLYLDHAATTPVLDEVVAEMEPFLKEKFHNPSAGYGSAYEVKEAIEEARGKVAGLINAEPGEIVFTSGSTEGNNSAIIGLALANIEKGRHIVITRAEHHSVFNAARYLQNFFDFVINFVPIDKEGFVNPDDIEKAITDETTLVSVIHSNYEVGSVQAIDEIVRVAKEKKEDVLFHTDAVASAGQVDIDVKKLGVGADVSADEQGVDALTFSSHTLYGPKGVGALYLKEGIDYVPLIYGGIQEEGRRGGTENVPGIVGFGKACEIALRDIDSRIKHYTRLRNMIIEGVEGLDIDVKLTGPSISGLSRFEIPSNENLASSKEKLRLPNHASFVAGGVHGEAVEEMLDSYGIEMNTGSVCVSKAFLSSPILLSMGYSRELAQGSVVFTVGISNTVQDVKYLLDVLPQSIEGLRALLPG